MEFGGLTGVADRSHIRLGQQLALVIANEDFTPRPLRVFVLELQARDPSGQQGKNEHCPDDGQPDAQIQAVVEWQFHRSSLCTRPQSC